jgi:hypothetical protein
MEEGGNCDTADSLGTTILAGERSNGRRVLMREREDEKKSRLIRPASGMRFAHEGYRQGSELLELHLLDASASTMALLAP